MPCNRVYSCVGKQRACRLKRPKTNDACIVVAQSGYFTTRQGAEAGYSSQLLLKHIRAGRVVSAQRGIYRLVHFPASEHEELVTAWLWSEQSGVLSHQTALSLHGLSDVLPAQIHITLPAMWRQRRFSVPHGVVLHHAELKPFGGLAA